MAFIAGGFTATWNALAVGQLANGFTLSHKFFKRLVTGDNYAEAPQDGIFRGAEMFIDFTCIAFDAAAIQSLMWPYSATRWDMGVVGRTDVGGSLAKSLVLTAVAGTPAATTPATLTTLLSILAEGFPMSILLAPDLREAPIKLRIYPSTSGIFATQT